MSSRIAVFGESLVDVTRTGTTETVKPGGSPLNVAVGLARLGIDVEFATQFGDDARGRLIRDHLDASGVVVTAGSMSGRPTSSAEATIADDGGVTYRF